MAFCFDFTYIFFFTASITKEIIPEGALKLNIRKVHEFCHWNGMGSLDVSPCKSIRETCGLVSAGRGRQHLCRASIKAGRPDQKVTGGGQDSISYDWYRPVHRPLFFDTPM